VFQEPHAIPPESVLAHPSQPQSLAALNALLDTIPSLFSEALSSDADPSPALGEPSASQAALLAAVDLARSNGGKIHLFVSSLPNVGVHRLKPRHKGGSPEGGAAALVAKQEVLGAVEARWKGAAVMAAEAQICVDISFLTQVLECPLIDELDKFSRPKMPSCKQDLMHLISECDVALTFHFGALVEIEHLIDCLRSCLVRLASSQ
jgi:hypothetical protein